MIGKRFRSESTSPVPNKKKLRILRPSSLGPPEQVDYFGVYSRDYPTELTEEALHQWDNIMAPSKAGSRRPLRATDSVTEPREYYSLLTKSSGSPQVISPQKIYVELKDADIPVLDLAADDSNQVPEAITKLRTGVFKDIHIGYIPESCKSHIQKADPAGYLDIIPSSYRADRPEDNGLWEFVEKFREAARETGAGGSDEADWSLKVFRPMLQYCAGSKSKTMDVTTDDIDLMFAVNVDTGTIENRIDYALCLSIKDPQVERLYKKIRKAQLALSPMFRSPTRDEVIYFGIEVEPTNVAKPFEALLRLLTWTSALHAANHILIERALFNRTRESTSEHEIKITAMPTIGGIVVGHDWSFYFALRTPAERTLGYVGDDIKVCNVGPLPALTCSTMSYEGIFKLIHVLKKINEWGVNTYWPWLRDDVLNHAALAG